MLGNSQCTAKQQFDNLAQEGKKLLNNISIILAIISANIEEENWSMDKEPKLHKKNKLKTIKTAYDTKLKRYTYNENTTVPENEVIRIELGDIFLHYCFYPDQGTYIRIKDPNKEHSAKSRSIN